MLSGDERTNAVDDEGCCVCCGFKERLLVAYEDDATSRVSVHCEECFANKTLTVSERHAVAYLPELSVAALSHFTRVCAWYSFATRCGFEVTPLDIVEGTIPSEFSDKKGWQKPAADAASDKHGTKNLAAEALSKNGYAFLRGRIDVAAAQFGALTLQKFIKKIGEAEFAAKYRILPLSIPIGRVRSWGKGDASFFRVARPALADSDLLRDFQGLLKQ
jgi:hypothetical protein